MSALCKATRGVCQTNQPHIASQAALNNPCETAILGRSDVIWAFGLNRVRSALSVSMKNENEIIREDVPCSSLASTVNDESDS